MGKMQHATRSLLRAGFGAGLAITAYMVVAAIPWTRSESSVAEGTPMVGKASVGALQTTLPALVESLCRRQACRSSYHAAVDPRAV
jgi:hypothetical protein